MDISGDNIPIVFTHNDLCAPNVLLSRGTNPRVAAIIDWGQSGWYPSYWEYCKARRVSGRWLQDQDLNSVMREEWWAQYLPMVVDLVDDIIYHPFIYFLLSNI